MPYLQIPAGFWKVLCSMRHRANHPHHMQVWRGTMGVFPLLPDLWKETPRGLIMMSLCGKRPCPGVCSRVCHCQAGQTRVHWLWLIRRGYRVGTPTKPWMKRVKSDARAPATQTYPTHNWKQAPPYGQGNLRQYASTAFLTGLLALIALVIALGLIFNGPSIIGYYEPPHISVNGAGW